MASRRAPVVKKLLLYRNGDPTFKPVKWTYNSKKVQSFEALLDECERRVGAKNGAQNVYTLSGRRIISLHELEEWKDDGFVVAGKEAFKDVRDGYENIGKSRAIKARAPLRERPKGAKNHDKPPASGVPSRSPRRNSKPKTPTIDDELPRRSNGPDYRQMNKKQFPDSKSKYANYNVETRRIYLLKSGDPDFQPKRYLWRSVQIRTWAAFLKDIETFVKPDQGRVRSLFTQDGKEVTDFTELRNEEAYVVAGDEGYIDLRTALQTRGGERPKRDRPPPSRRSGGPPTRARSRSRSRTDLRTPRIMQRQDQIKPKTMNIYVFLNGKGFKGQRFTYTDKQLDKGIPWIIEQISKHFVVYGKKLTTMDGEVIKTVLNLENRGAYVLLTQTESKFRDCWYFLPEGFLDTSVEAREERERAAAGDEEEYGGGGGGYDSAPSTRHQRSSRRSPDRSPPRSAPIRDDEQYGYGTYERRTPPRRQSRSDGGRHNGSEDSRTESEQGHRRHRSDSRQDDFQDEYPPYPDEEYEEPGRYVRAQTAYNDRYYEVDEDDFENDDEYFDDEENYVNAIDDQERREERSRRGGHGDDRHGRGDSRDRHRPGTNDNEDFENDSNGSDHRAPLGRRRDSRDAPAGSRRASQPRHRR